MLMKISQNQVGINYISAVQGDIIRSALDNRHIANDFGWSPKTKLEEGLKKTWNWFKEYYV